MLVTEEDFLKNKENIDHLTKIIRFKRFSLNEDLLSYIRAHLLVEYEGSEISKIKMTEPAIIDYELMVMEQYQYILLLLKDGRFADFNLENE